MSRKRRPPGTVRDAIIECMKRRDGGCELGEIIQCVKASLGEVATSSIRSSLQLNDNFERIERGRYRLREK